MDVNYKRNNDFGYENVFICGGGHQGLSMAAHLALNGVNVSLWNRTPQNIEYVKKTHTINCTGIINGIARINNVSSSMEDVITKFIMIVTPSNAHKELAKKIAPFIDKDTIIILNPGRTFGAIEFAEELKKNGIKKLPHVAETQTIVYTCRRNGENSATIFTIKKDVKLASISKYDTEFILSKIPNCIRNNFVSEDSIAITSLSNVGMILHCAPVLMNIGWIETDTVDFKYYYDGISKSIASFLEKMDKERLEVAKAMGYEVESVLDWLKRTYEISGDTLYDAIHNNLAYKYIDAPRSINSRYITEDVPNGLVPIEYIGKQLGVKVDNITLIIDLANSIMNCNFRKSGRQFSLNVLKRYI